MVRVTRRELDVPLEVRSMAPLREFVNEVARESGLPPEIHRAGVIAIDEACTSIIRNADNGHTPGNLRVLIDVDTTRVKINISDTAPDVEFDTVTREQLVHEFSRGQRNEIGTRLIRRVMDEFSYNYKKGFQSEIEMIKFI